MNPFRFNNNLNSSIPSPPKMKKSSGAVTLADKSLVKKTPRVTLVDIFQKKSLDKDNHSNQQNGEKSDSDKSSPRSFRRRPTASSVVIPESGSETDSEETQTQKANDLTCERECCRTGIKKHLIKTGKAQSVTSLYSNILGRGEKPDLYRSLSQDHRPRFMRDHKLKSPKKAVKKLTMSQPVNDSSPSPAHVIRSTERLRKLRQRPMNPVNHIRSLFPSHKYLENGLESPIVRDKVVSDEEIIIDEGDSEVKYPEGQSEKVSSSVDMVIDLSDHEESVTSTCDKPIDVVGDSANGRNGRKNVELIEAESDGKEESISDTPVKKQQENIILVHSSSSESSGRSLRFRRKAVSHESIECEELRGFSEFERKLPEPKCHKLLDNEENDSGIIEVVDLDDKVDDDTDSDDESSSYELKKATSSDLKLRKLSINLSKDKLICDAHISKTRSMEEQTPRDDEITKVEAQLSAIKEKMESFEKTEKIKKIKKIKKSKRIEKNEEFEEIEKPEEPEEMEKIDVGLEKSERVVAEKVRRESEEISEKLSEPVLPKINVLTVDQAEELGHAIRPATKARLKAEQKEEKLAAKISGKKRGRKAGTKNKPRSKPRDEDSTYRPSGPSGGKKRGRKKKIPSNAEQNHNNNDQSDVPCCIERGCCCTTGCLHGNNHKRPGRLPSLPEKTEYIFEKQQFDAAVREKNAQLHAQQELETVSLTSDTSHLLGMSCNNDTTTYHTASKPAPRPAAVIEFPPIVISGDPDLNGKAITGFTVPLVPETVVKQVSSIEDKVSDDLGHDEGIDSSPDSRENRTYNTRNHGKPKIIQEKLLPKGTIDLPTKMAQSPLTPSSDAQDSTSRKRTYEMMSASEPPGGTSSFGIKSTIPCKKSLNPPKSSKSFDLESIASKLSSALSTWKAIPEIAALLEPPTKKFRVEQPLEPLGPLGPLDEETMDIDIPLVKAPEKRKSLISQSVNNSDLNNGIITNSSSVLKGLFSDPHILPSSSAKDRRRSEKTSRRSETSSKKKDAPNKNEEILKNKREENADEKRDKFLSLTRANLEALDKSCSSKASVDVITNIMSQMQPPGKSLISNKTPDPSNRLKISPGISKIERKNLIKDEKIRNPNECSALIKTRLQGPEKKPIKKKKERNGRWTLNDDDNSSATSTETHPSAMMSYKSSTYSPIKFGGNGAGKKFELIDSWLNKDTTLNNESKDENSHSPHSAKTFMISPPPEEEKTVSEALTAPLDSPKDSDKDDENISGKRNEIVEKRVNGNEKCGENEDNELDDESSHSSSSLTATKSLSDSHSEFPSQGKAAEKKRSSLEVDVNGNTRDALEEIPKRQEKSKEKGEKDKDVVEVEKEEEEEDDALFLDCQEDDLFFDERSVSNEDMKAKPIKEKPAAAKPPIEKNDAALKKRLVTTRKIVMATAPEKPAITEKKTIIEPLVRRIHSNTDSGNFSADLRNNGRVVNKENVENGGNGVLNRESTGSDLYQMGNVERYASQNRREFNDAYYGYSQSNEADIHEPGDDYDPYAPVKQQAPSMHFPQAPEPYFKNLCWANLKTGKCNRIDCHYHNNKYTVYLQNLSKAPALIIEKVLSHALEKNFFHLLTEIYPEAIKSLELRPIQRICTRIRNEVVKFRTRDGIKTTSSAWIFYQSAMNPTVHALTAKGYTPMTILNILSNTFLLSEDEERKKLMRALISTKQVPPGEHWTTFEPLIRQFTTSLPGFAISPILEDCMRFEKSREYLQAVFENVIRRTPETMLTDFAERGLLRSFEQFLQPPEMHQAPQRSGTPVPEDLQEFNANENNPPASPEPETRETKEISPIASPDSVKPAGIVEREKQKENIPEVKKKHVKERLGPRVIRTSRNVEKVEPLELIPIDGVKKPQSVYRKYLWKLHIDLKSIQANLKHREYERVIEILSRVKKELVEPFAQGFYLILCEEIMTSTDHLEAIIKCSVGGRRFRALPLLSEIGALLLIKLADRGLWILAYRLFKTLQRIFLMKKSTKYFLLTSEILIANHRPLQAFSLLKQHKLISMRCDKSSRTSHLQNESLRISVAKSLIKSLCQNNPHQAFDVFKMILQEQNNSFSPFDLSIYIDDVCYSLIKFNKTDELIEMTRLVIHRNLIIQEITLRSILVRIFHHDIVLSRQLYEYAIWIGIYPITKFESPVYLRVNTDWVEEEMFLQISDLLTRMRKLFDPLNKTNSPQEISVWLNFENVNSKGEFSLIHDTIGGEYNDVLLKNAKILMRQVLKRFDPEIRVACDMERIFKLMSQDIIEFLTSDHIF